MSELFGGCCRPVGGGGGNGGALRGRGGGGGSSKGRKKNGRYRGGKANNPPYLPPEVSETPCRAPRLGGQELFRAPSGGRPSSKVLPGTDEDADSWKSMGLELPALQREIAGKIKELVCVLEEETTGQRGAVVVNALPSFVFCLFTHPSSDSFRETFD